MTIGALAISASDEPSSHADWLEWRALYSADRNSSTEELLSHLRLGGTAELLEEEETPAADTDLGGAGTEARGTQAWDEVEDRALACSGVKAAYPFEINKGMLQFPKAADPDESLYVFLLALALIGPRRFPGVPQPERTFEDVACSAAEGYFGGTGADVQVYPFGFPRRIKPAGFMPALDELCRLLGEGGGARRCPRTSEQKDAKLDLVVWRRFADQRAAQLVGFGQCAAGLNWREKQTELNPLHFQRLWMQEHLAVDPVRLFFVPHRVDRILWREVGIQGGIVFDRCRIVQFVGNLDKEIVDRCRKWTRAALKHLGVR